jgi:hypothetical protein
MYARLLMYVRAYIMYVCIVFTGNINYKQLQLSLPTACRHIWEADVQLRSLLT